jgi:hypothetical protein
LYHERPSGVARLPGDADGDAVAEVEVEKLRSRIASFA